MSAYEQPSQFQIAGYSTTNASSGMQVSKKSALPAALLYAGLLVSGGLCGCQANIGGQTLPSGYYLRDDVQYFPAGPEQPLPNQVRAMEEYKAQQGIYAREFAQ